MAADNFTATLSLQYTPPGAPVNSGVATLAAVGTYNANSVGTVDVPPGTVVGTTFSIPFSSIAAAKLCVIRNNMSSAIGIRINGAVANNFQVAAGGEFMYASPAAPGSDPLTSIVVVTTVDPTQIERISYWVFGD